MILSVSGANERLFVGTVMGILGVNDGVCGVSDGRVVEKQNKTTGVEVPQPSPHFEAKPKQIFFPFSTNV